MAGLLVLAALAVGGLVLPAAVAQDGDEEAAQEVFLRPEYALRSKLATARQLVRQRRYGEAVQLAQDLISREEDYFLKPDESPREGLPEALSLKSAALQLLAEMPPEGRQWYELQFGPAAQRQLDAAVAAGNLDGVLDVARTFFHCAAGRRATLLAAHYHADHGRPLAAARCYICLQQSPAADDWEPMLSVKLALCWRSADRADDARRVLAELKKRSADRPVKLGGRDVALPGAGEDALAWLERIAPEDRAPRDKVPADWAMFGGNPARTGVSGGGTPLRAWRWYLSTSHGGGVHARIDQLRRAYADREFVALPALHPLAIGDRVYLRTTTNLTAVDLRTGKRVWNSHPPEDLAAPTAEDDDAQTDREAVRRSLFDSRRPDNPAEQFAVRLDERLWRDAVYGRLSSDGRSVFAVEGLGPLVDAEDVAVALDGVGNRVLRPRPRSDDNLLVAYGIADAGRPVEGQRRWSVGGEDGADEAKLAGAFFLGPPLALEGRLYALLETPRKQIVLAVLDADTGRLQWSQQLALVEKSVQADRIRRFAGGSPSYSDGMLVCPTSSGAVVAVDLTSRKLAWGFRYPHNENGQYLREDRVTALKQDSEESGGDAWEESSVMLADGVALVSPVDNFGSVSPSGNPGNLYCVELDTGRRLWTRRRDHALYVAAATRGTVLLVDSKQVAALRLADGKSAWNGEAILLGEGVLPSGRGFLGGQTYHLPLTSGEILQIDVAGGQVTGRVKLAGGFVPGNLICHRGQVISQGADHVAVFHQLEKSREWIAETLNSRPDHPAAWTRRGQIHLEAGRLNEAISDLRRAAAGDRGNEQARQLLVEALLAALSRSENGGRLAAEELAAVVETPAERARLLQSLGEARQRAGQPVEALDVYLELAALNLAHDRLGMKTPEMIDETDRSVAAHRWLRARMGSLYREAPSELRVRLNERVQSRVALAGLSSVAGPDSEAPRSLKTAVGRFPWLTGPAKDRVLMTAEPFLDVFTDFPAADDVREVQLALLEELEGQPVNVDTLLVRQRLLQRLKQSPDANRRGRATAALAALYDDARHPRAAAEQYHELAGQYAGVVCLDGKTGKQLAAAVDGSSPVGRRMQPPRPWPRGAVTVSGELPTELKVAARHGVAVITSGSGDSHGGPSGVRFDQATRTVWGHDSLGARLWQARLKPDGGEMYADLLIGPRSATQSGHLLVFSSGKTVHAIDTLRAARSPVGAVRWRQRRTEQIPGIVIGLTDQYSLNFGSYYRSRVAGTREDPPLLVTAEGVVYQRMRELVCVDPLSGQTIWVRRDVPKHCELFGDDEVLLAVPPPNEDRTQPPALVLRTLDGERLGERQLPPGGDRLATVGRLVLTRDYQGGKLLVRLIDPAKADLPDVVPPRTFEIGSRHTLVEDRLLAVVEPGGRLLLMRLPRPAAAGDAAGPREYGEAKLLLDTKLPPQRSMREIILLPTTDQYLLIVNGPSPRSDEIDVQPLSDEPGAKMINGPMFAFDRRTLRPLWQSPARIVQFGLLPNQPGDLPLLVLARRIELKASRPGSKKVWTDLLCLDKRTGRAVWEQTNMPASISSVALVGGRRPAAVSLRLDGKNLGDEAVARTLTWTDQPVPPEPPYQGNHPQDDRPGIFESSAKSVGDSLKQLQRLQDGNEADPFGEENPFE